VTAAVNGLSINLKKITATVSNDLIILFCDI